MRGITGGRRERAGIPGVPAGRSYGTIVLFEERYITIGYFDRETSFPLGLVAIVIQGATLSALFPLVRLAALPGA